jgi:hypothetical protein
LGAILRTELNCRIVATELPRLPEAKGHPISRWTKEQEGIRDALGDVRGVVVAHDMRALVRQQRRQRFRRHLGREIARQEKRGVTRPNDDRRVNLGGSSQAHDVVETEVSLHPPKHLLHGVLFDGFRATAHPLCQHPSTYQARQHRDHTDQPEDPDATHHAVHAGTRSDESHAVGHSERPSESGLIKE